MPVPTDTLYNMPRLNRWFAVSSLGLLLSLVWMIWEDYDRPWRGFQDEYMVAQAALAHVDYVETQTEAYQSKIADARAKVEQAKAAVALQAKKRADLSAKLREQNKAFDGIDSKFSNAEAVLQVTRSEYEVARGAYGDDDSRTKSIHRRLDSEEGMVASMRLEKEKIEDAQASLKKQLKKIDAPVLKAQKELTALEKVASDAQLKEEQYSNVLVKTVINLPLADFTAPKGTPARYEVRQLVLPDVRQDLNYLQTYTTDRCTTCHLAINDPNFSRENLARRFERALPALNESLTKQGLTALPSPVVPELSGEDVPQLVVGNVTSFWSYLTDEQQESYADQLMDLVNVYLEATGRKDIRVGQPLLAHPNLALFVDIDSPHPMKKIGCTVCHEGNPQETDFVQAAHTPVTHEQEEEWKEKYYVTAAFIPNVTFDTVEHHWERPMLPPKYAEAGCSKCHNRVADISEFHGESQAQRLNLGRDLFLRVGCINCHNVKEFGNQRRVGPDLRRVGSKLSRDFVEQWVFHPKKFRPSTWMPHFFLQENNEAGSENSTDPDPVLRTEAEVSAIAQYLYTLSEPFQPAPIPDGLTGDVARGRKLFSQVGCLGCHANVSEYGRQFIVDDLVHRAGRSEEVADALFNEMSYVDRARHLMQYAPTDRDTVFAPETIEDRHVFTRFAPDLSSIGQKVGREWLFGWLKNPADYFAETRMPSLRLTDQEALDLSEYLLTLKENQTFEMGEFPRDQAHLDMIDAQVLEILRGQNSTRRSRAIMKDEGGELTDMLVESLSAYWGKDKARRKLSRMDTASKRSLLLGSKMIAHYGCYACHSIGGFEKTPPPGTDLSSWGEKPLSQLDFAFFDSAHSHIRVDHPEVYGHVYRPENEDLIYWSFDRNQEANITHTRAAFAKYKLLNPRIWDREKIKNPYDKLKMPNFYFTPQQVDALVTFLLSRVAPRVRPELKVDYDSTLTGAIADGRTLTRTLNCVGCHKIEDNVATVHQYIRHEVGGEDTFDEVNAPPWLRGEGAKVQYPWLYGFLHDVEKLRPWLKIRMPSFNLSEEETTTLVEYFAGISQREAATLRAHLNMVEDYVKKAESSSKASGSDDGSKAARWFTADSVRSTAEFLASYAVKNRLVLTYDVDPAANSVEELEEGYELVLDKTRFTADLFDVRFPFADRPRPLVDQERFGLGEQLFFELQCLACHVLGDQNVPGANKQPSAPNLNLTHKRLRQEWVHQWLQEPAAIQPGTKMPQWFAGAASAFADYPSEDRAALESKYGETGQEQMQLLMDFIYNAGVRNFAAIQPGGVVADEGTPAGDDVGDDEEEEEEEDDEEEEDGEEEDE